MTLRRSIRLSLLGALCLLLGTATTVGVAWRLHLHRNLHFQTEAQRETIYWPDWAPRSWPAPDEARMYRGVGWSCQVTVAYPRTLAATSWCGWPMAALWCGHLSPLEEVPADASLGWTLVSWRRGLLFIEDVSAGSMTFPEATGFAFVRSGRTYGKVFLPVAPLWHGFAADTAIYAAAWYLLLFTPLPLYRTGRRRIRVSRGMCGSCGYDPKGSAGGVCPECGIATGAKA